jgi:hypothetical protein
MTNQVHRVAKGVTLIESIIYVGLTAFLLIAVLGATYPILSGAERSSDRITADGESVFVARKIGWAMGSVTGVTAPTAGAQGTVLTLTRPDGTYSFTNSSGVMYIAVNGGTPVPLTASRTAITNFSVSHLAPAGGAPRAIDVSFQVNGNTIGPLRMYARY